jgi:hypothetical protein
MGKKHRNRINGQKKNNHVPKEALIAEDAAHAKEYSAAGGRKNGPGHHDNRES